MIQIITAHAGAKCAEVCIATWGVEPLIVPGPDGVLPAYQRGLEQTTASILAFIHDDVRIDEPDWLARVEREFDDPEVGMCGFGGAFVHGTHDLYRVPYHFTQLGRAHYMSNVDDAEVHGTRFKGSCEVAVLDGYALIVRRSILERAGGWPLNTPIGYSLYDYWLCCETHRQGYKIRLVGVRCHHMGGQTAVALKKAAGEGDAHERAHRWLYDHYRDVLPWEAPALVLPVTVFKR